MRDGSVTFEKIRLNPLSAGVFPLASFRFRCVAGADFPRKGKPVVRRGRKTMGPFCTRIARFPKGENHECIESLH